MLPTTGHFKHIDCPYYVKSCDRPYCHFRHRKKGTEPGETSSSGASAAPTYNPTPKSQLANVKSHIPISYVPDLAVRSDRNSSRYQLSNDKPTYNPTPLNMLPSKIALDEPSITYNPTPIKETSEDINFEELETEFDMIDAIMNDSNEEPEQNNTINHTKTKPKKTPPKKKVSEPDKHKKQPQSTSDHKRKKDTKHKEKDKTKRSSPTSKKNHTSGSSSSKHKKSKKEDRNKIKAEPPKQPKVPEYNGDYNINFDETDVEDECYKIFTEYKPSEPELSLDVGTKPSHTSEPLLSGKKRIAHDFNNQVPPKISHKPKTVHPSAAHTMLNRFKKITPREQPEETYTIAEMQLDILKKSMDHVVHQPKVSKPTIKTVPMPSTSLIDDIIGGRPKKRRIAPVQNVNSIQRAKEKVNLIAKQQASSSLSKTISQSLSKGSKRMAHTPEANALEIPDLLDAERSKLPVNVRTRFLKMVYEETTKLYFSKEEAQHRAATDEHKCYERCSVLATYRNSMMLAVNRIRKELKDRDNAGLGPLFPGETTGNSKATIYELKGPKFYENIKRFVLKKDELVLHGFPQEGSIPGRAVIKQQTTATHQNHLEASERICSRCTKLYKVNKEGFALYEEECQYHPLKKRTLRGESMYLCCKTGDGAGCATAPTHVSELKSAATEIDGYQTTMEPEDENDPRSTEIFALDCEMCYTTKGLELTRVTIVNAECKTVYETLVKPFNPIIDYNTRFSGITPEQMDRTATNILQVQANILHLCNSKTILVGHSLESDMKALKIIHNTIIDTSVLFPHKFGLPHKRALRDLAREFLKKIIQNDVSGHDSAEDALTCMELLQWKIKEDFKTKGIKCE